MAGPMAGFTGGSRAKQARLEILIESKELGIKDIKRRLNELNQSLQNTKTSNRKLVKEKNNLVQSIKKQGRHMNALKENYASLKKRENEVAAVHDKLIQKYEELDGRTQEGKAVKKRMQYMGDQKKQLTENSQTLRKRIQVEKAEIQATQDGINLATREISSNNQKINGTKREIQQKSQQLNVEQSLNRQRKGSLNQTKKNIKENERFRYEWLGIMFAGMALQRVFGGYIGKMKQMFGITDMFSTMITIALIPIFKQLLPLFIRVFKWFNNLSKGQQEFIGWVIIGTFVLGTLMFVFGQLALAVNSIIGLINSLSGAMTALTMTIGKVMSSTWLMTVTIQALTFALVILVTILSGVIIKYVVRLVNELEKLDEIKFSNLSSGLKIVYAVLQGIRATVNGMLIPLSMAYDLLKGITTRKFEFGATKARIEAIQSATGYRQMAEGGIVTRPTMALIGERGPEAVVPLSRASGIESGGNALTMNPTINVNATVSNNIDIHVLARRIFEELQVLQSNALRGVM